MTRCQGITKSGKRCKVNGQCRWHLALPPPSHDCIVCLDEIPYEQSALPCGHWIHGECIQKHADAMQELRVQEGFPPLSEGMCAICRAPVPDVIPKQVELGPAGSTVSVQLSNTDVHTAMLSWMVFGGPFSMHIWVKLREQYPEEQPLGLLLVAGFLTDILVMGQLQEPLGCPPLSDFI